MPRLCHARYFHSQLIVPRTAQHHSNGVFSAVPADQRRQPHDAAPVYSLVSVHSHFTQHLPRKVNAQRRKVSAHDRFLLQLSKCRKATFTSAAIVNRLFHFALFQQLPCQPAALGLHRNAPCQLNVGLPAAQHFHRQSARNCISARWQAAIAYAAGVCRWSPAAE